MGPSGDRFRGLGKGFSGGLRGCPGGVASVAYFFLLLNRIKIDLPTPGEAFYIVGVALALSSQYLERPGSIEALPP